MVRVNPVSIQDIADFPPSLASCNQWTILERPRLDPHSSMRLPEGKEKSDFHFEAQKVHENKEVRTDKRNVMLPNFLDFLLRETA